MLPALIVLCEGNPPVTIWFLSLKANNAELWWFLYCLSKQADEHTVELRVISEAMTLI